MYRIIITQFFVRIAHFCVRCALKIYELKPEPKLVEVSKKSSVIDLYPLEHWREVMEKYETETKDFGDSKNIRASLSNIRNRNSKSIDEYWEKTNKNRSIRVCEYSWI